MTDNIVIIRSTNWDYMGSTYLVKQKINANISVAKTRIGKAYEKFVNDCQYLLSNRD